MSYDWQQNPVLGIDLGTTNSAIAYWRGEGRGAVPYQVDHGENTLQSVVYYDLNHSTDEQQQFSAGKSALIQGALNPSYMAREFKRRMNDASPCILLGGRKFSPIELSAEVLKKIYSDVTRQFPEGVLQSRSTVVTVPYDFDEIACKNTEQAARMANINFKKLLQEPIAASLSYAFDQVDETLTYEKEEKILVFDLGGGTFDLTLFRLQQNPHKLMFEVLATGGHSKLGGIDFDECLTKVLLERSKISLENILEVKHEKIARRKLKDLVINTKHTLSHIDSSYCSIIDLLPGQHLDLTVGRQDFELSIEFYLNKIKSILSQLWQRAKIQPNEVDRIILVGGSSRIPCIRQLLIENIGSDIYLHPHPDLCVAEGAAIYAAYLEGLPVFGNREVEIVTNEDDVKISILNQKIEEVCQQVSSLELQVVEKKNEIKTLEKELEKEVEKKQRPPKDLRIGNLVEGTIIKITKNYHTGNESGIIIQGNYEGLMFKGFLHISNISKAFVQSISEHFTIGQRLKGVILKVNPDNNVEISTKVLEDYSGEMLENMDQVMSEAEAKLPQAMQQLSL